MVGLDFEFPAIVLKSGCMKCWALQPVLILRFFQDCQAF